jgi:Uma2 family endonuclease
MATVAQRLITAEEFAQMPDPPDGSQQELVKGVIVTMPPPKARHGVCCSKADFRLRYYAEANNSGHVFSNDTGWIVERDPDTVRGPDVAFWSRERLPEIPDSYLDVPPDLAVEVVSPGDRYSRVQNKVRQYLRSGVRMVWVVDPEDRSITVYRSQQEWKILGENDILTGEDVLPNFSCRVADLLP